MYISKPAITITTLLHLTSAAPAPSAPPASLSPRATTSGSFTWYETGLGACGLWDVDSDYIAALNAPQFDPNTPANGNPNDNALCGRHIRIYYGGNSVNVTVADRCPECAWGSLDLSPAALSGAGEPGCRED